MGLHVTDVADRQTEILEYEVQCLGIRGVSAGFVCGDVIVSSVRPCTDAGEVIESRP